MEEEDYSSLPLTDRAIHKQWKVRQQAYEEMKKQFTQSGSESDGCFRPFVDNSGLYKKIVSDSNVAAQEIGIASLVAFLEFGGVQAALRTRNAVVPSLVEKGLASNRQGTRQKSVDGLLWYIELDTPDPVIEEMVPFLSHRNPKLVTNTLAALVEIFKAFGGKTVSPKPLLKDLTKLFGHADKNVRATATELVIELYRWLGDGVSRAILPELKPVQQKELQEQFDNIKSSGANPHQQRYLKLQREAMERQSGEFDGGNALVQEQLDQSKQQSDDDDDDDDIDMSEPVDVIAKLPSDLYGRISSVKWKERKEVLEEVQVLLKVSKIQNDDFGELLRALAKVIAKDANIMVVTVAANCVECLAKGLRQEFAKYTMIVISPILERTKEKKASVAEALGNALDAIYKTGSFSEVVEPIVEFLPHKTPQVRIETSKFLVRCLKSTKVCPRPNEQKLICEAGVKLLSDTQEPVRNQGAEILGVMMKIVGPRALTPYLEGVDDIKKAKVEDFYQKAEVKARPEKEKPKRVPASVTTNKEPVARQRMNHAASPVAKPKQQPRQSLARPTKLLGTPGRLAAPGSLKRPLNSPVKPPALNKERPGLSSRGREDHGLRDSKTEHVQSTSGGRSGATGLTNRSLRAPTNTPARQQLGSSQPTPSSLPEGFVAELEQLRQERAEWMKEREQLQWKNQEDYNEKARLMQEINELQLRNAHLVEEHTRDVLAIKSKETQLIRAQSDVDTARVRIAKLEAEIDRLRHGTDGSDANVTTATATTPAESGSSERSLRSLNTGRSSAISHHRTVYSPKSPSMTLQFGLDTRKSMRGSVDLSSLDSEISNLQTQAGLPARPASMMLTSTSEEKENRDDSSDFNNDKESWKRAAEITNQLKARIELMKKKTTA